MSAPRILVALVAALGALTTSVGPTPLGKGSASASAGNDHRRLSVGASEGAIAKENSLNAAVSNASVAAWPPALLIGAPAAISATLERSSNGAHKLVVRNAGTFMHLRYRDAVSGGPDFAAIELRAGDKPPPADIAIWESTNPNSLVTERGIVRFSLSSDQKPEALSVAEPRSGPRMHSKVRTCQSYEDVTPGFSVVCHIAKESGTVSAIKPANKKPLSGAWVWDVPKSKESKKKSRFVRLDLPLSAGGADGGVIGYAHQGRGVMLRAEATWPSLNEKPAFVFTETSRSQPVSPFFSWR